MTYSRILVCTCVLALSASVIETAEAGGSSGGYASWSGYGSSGGYASSGGGYASSGGGYASSGGSSGGAILANMRARIAARHSARWAGSSGGSSGGYRSYSWGSSGGSYGSSGGVGIHRLRLQRPSLGSSGGSHGSSGGYVGPLRRLATKIQHRRAALGSSGGSSSGGSSGGAVSYHSNVSSVSYLSGGGSSGGVANYSQPAAHSVILSETEVYESMTESAEAPYSAASPPVPAEIPAQPPVPSASDVPPASPPAPVEAPEGQDAGQVELRSDMALLKVSVPSTNAIVRVNGHRTSSVGIHRQFISDGLAAETDYPCVVEATYMVNGQQKTEAKTLVLRSGATHQVAFEQAVSSPVAQDVVTTVKLNVPADAQVTLAGNTTNGSGAVRTFRTKQLKSGQSWNDYTIRVTATVNGRAVSQERTVAVDAGSVTELTFEFNDQDIAQL